MKLRYILAVGVAAIAAGCSTSEGKFPTPEEFSNYNKEKQVATFVDDLPKKGKERDRILSIAIARDRLSINETNAEVAANTNEITTLGHQLHGREVKSNERDDELEVRIRSVNNDLTEYINANIKEIKEVKSRTEVIERVLADAEATGRINTSRIAETKKPFADLLKKYNDLLKNSATKQEIDDLKEDYRNPLLKIAQDNMVNLRAMMVEYKADKAKTDETIKAMIIEYKADKAEYKTNKSKSDEKIKALQRLVKELIDAKPPVEVVPQKLELSPVPKVLGIIY